MKPDIGNINRLGFEAWADNLIVNALEDMKASATMGWRDYEEGDVTLVIRTDGKQATATVRAYVTGKGWCYHDRVIHLKGGKR